MNKYLGMPFEEDDYLKKLENNLTSLEKRRRITGDAESH